MLAKLDEVLKDTRMHKYAIPAFNVFGYEDAKACVEAAEQIQAPVILATNKVAIQYMSIHVLGKLLVGIAEEASVPVVVHLDHGKDYATVAQAIKAGYSSVMYDGSLLPFEENVRTTKEIVQLAHAFGIPVEAEIGSVGYSDQVGMDGSLTDPEAAAFAEQTNIDALAVAVGTVHRMEQQSASLQFDRIKQIESLVSVPLVMHGSSGIPDQDLAKIPNTNFGKVNIGTALRMAFGNTLRSEMEKNPDVFDRLELFKAPMEAVKQAALTKMRLLNLENYHGTKSVVNN